MDDDNDDKDDTKRKSRNLSEKKRRDQFNKLVNELSALISTSNRKMDKSTVLKSTIVFLKHHNEIAVKSKVHEIREDWKPAFLSNQEFTHLMLEALNGFIIIFSDNGQIIYTSENVTSLLGHLPSELVNLTMYDLAYEADHPNIYNIFLNPSPVIDSSNSDIVLSTSSQVSLYCHLKRGGMDPDKSSYELVNFVGYFRKDVVLENHQIPNTQNQAVATTQSAAMPSTSTSVPGGDSGGNRLIFVGTGRVQKPQLIRDVSAVDPMHNEFTSKQSLEWKFLFLDHRAPPIIGYLPFEVLGTSGYDYYHVDDLSKVIASHEELIEKGEGTSCYYRFLTKGQQWIWLQTKYHITYHQWNAKPDYVLCTHRVVSYSEVLRDANPNMSMSMPFRTMDSATTKMTQNASATTVDCGGNWSQVRSNRMSRANMQNSVHSQNVKRRMKLNSCRGNDSDSTSLSADSAADSAASRHSLMTHCSSQFRAQQSHMHQPHHNHQQKMYTSMPQTPQASPQMVPSTSCQFPHPNNYPIRTPQIVGHTFLEPRQYLAAIPVQPVISPFAAVQPVLSPIENASAIIPNTVVMAPSQMNGQTQEDLQRKHDELQSLVLQQQDELRRVSEQLLRAQYALLQPVVPVTYHNEVGPSRNFAEACLSFAEPVRAYSDLSQQHIVDQYAYSIPPEQMHNPPLQQHDFQQPDQQLQQPHHQQEAHLPHYDQHIAVQHIQPQHPPAQQHQQIHHEQSYDLLGQTPIQLDLDALANSDDNIISFMQLAVEPDTTSFAHRSLVLSEGSETQSEQDLPQQILTMQQHPQQHRQQLQPHQQQQAIHSQMPNRTEMHPYQMMMDGQAQMLLDSQDTHAGKSQ